MTDDIKNIDDTIVIPDWGSTVMTLPARPAGWLNWKISDPGACGHTVIWGPTGRGMTSCLLDLMTIPRKLSKGWRRHLRRLKAAKGTGRGIVRGEGTRPFPLTNPKPGN